MRKRKIILASASPWRRRILSDAGVSFTAETSGYKENMNRKLSPQVLAEKLALGKATAVAKRHKNAIVIGADTLIEFKGKILGKPKTRTLAKEMLKSFSGTTHTIITGFAIVDSKTSAYIARTVSTKVAFKKLSSADIDKYVKTGEPLRAAGGYAIQDGGSKLIKAIKGDHDNVAGLPLKVLLVELEKFEKKVIHTPERKSVARGK